MVFALSTQLSQWKVTVDILFFLLKYLHCGYEEVNFSLILQNPAEKNVIDISIKVLKF